MRPARKSRASTTEAVSLLETLLRAEARAAHQGRTTQVWDAEVTRKSDGRQMTLFRCTQLILWPKPKPKP